MNIKQKNIFALTAIFISIVLLVSIGYYSEHKIKSQEERLFKSEEMISRVTKVKQAHVSFISKLEQDYILNRPSNLNANPTTCLLGKLLKDIKGKIPSNLKSKFNEMIKYHNELHSLVAIYNNDYIKLPRGLKEETFEAFMKKYAWLLRVANIALGKNEKIENDHTKCSVAKYLNTHNKEFFAKYNLTKLSDITSQMSDVDKKLHKKAKNLSALYGLMRSDYYLKGIYSDFLKLRDLIEDYVGKLNEIDKKNDKIEQDIIYKAFEDFKHVISTLDAYIAHLHKKQEIIKEEIKSTMS
jgi:hypothetical protein